MARPNDDDNENNNDQNENNQLSFPSITSTCEHIAASNEFLASTNQDRARQTSHAQNLASSDSGASSGILKINGVRYKISNAKNLLPVITNMHRIMCYNTQRCKHQAENLTVHHKVRVASNELINITNRLNILIKSITRSSARYWPILQPELAYLAPIRKLPAVNAINGGGALQIERKMTAEVDPDDVHSPHNEYFADEPDIEMIIQLMRESQNSRTRARSNTNININNNEDDNNTTTAANPTDALKVDSSEEQKERKVNTRSDDEIVENQPPNETNNDEASQYVQALLNQMGELQTVINDVESRGLTQNTPITQNLQQLRIELNDKSKKI